MSRRLLAPVVSTALRSFAAVAAAALAACGGGEDDEPDAGPSPDCLEAKNHSDLAFIQDKIFTPSCTFTSCHRGAATMAGGLTLEAGLARDQLVGKPSDLDPSKQLVKPGDPANSYLLIISGKYPGIINPDVGTMPSRNPLLCTEKLDAMDRWIAAGAPST
jgi:hypothetical protein